MTEQVRYERIGPPRKLRRRTRRTTWRCRIAHVPEERFHRADAIHVAAHAVVAFDFGIPIRRAIFDGRQRVFEAAWASLAYARDDASSEARIALERDCITVQCGVVGRALALGWRPHRSLDEIIRAVAEHYRVRRDMRNSDARDNHALPARHSPAR